MAEGTPQPKRVLVLTDVHANLEAFSAVVDDAQQRGGFDVVWSLGDLVGYGPDPSACLDRLRSLPHVAVVGNHDLAAVGKMGLELFNPLAAAAARWSMGQLTQEHRDYLSGLPLTAEQGKFTLVHGSLRDPVVEYLLDEESALATFELLKTPRCLVGHSHVPFLCHRRGPRCVFLRLPEGERIEIGEERVTVNPGSVGQPRDGDPRAGYLLYNAEGDFLVYYRVTYDVEAVQRKMLAAGLPAPLAERLAHGR
ncbi:MAG: metallophosphoesterase family protein [Chloroflexi bacterium]|nr:metallophosphoesterase family protein [Chloroflexota bacterium]